MESNLGGEHVSQACRGTPQGDPSEEEDCEDDVGEDSWGTRQWSVSSKYNLLCPLTCEVDDFPRGCDTFHHDQEDNDPGRGQTENVPVLQSTEGI